MTTPELQDQSVERDRYALLRDAQERTRLEEQHKYLTETIGGTLIVSEDVKLHPGNRVLDCGTGAGSWLLALSKEVASGVELVGVDLSSAMFPKDFPNNVKFYEASITNLPSDWTNSFDFINQRLLVAAFTISQWRKAISEHFRVLKAGGAIQLMEFEGSGYLDGVDPATFSATKRALEITSTVYSRRDLVGFRVAHILPELLEGAGFTNVHLKDYQAPVGKSWGEIGVRGTTNCEAFFRGTARALAADDFVDICQLADELYDLIDRVKKEVDENPGYFVHFYVITAKKPL